MFESLKKRFSRASDQLTDKVTEEAKEENNIELIEESDESKEIQEDIKSEDIDDEDAEWDAIFDEEDEDDDEEETSEKKSGFFSRFSRNKDKDESSKGQVKRDRFAEALAEQEAIKEAEELGIEPPKKKHWYSRSKSEDDKEDDDGFDEDYYKSDYVDEDEGKKHWYSRKKQEDESINDKFKDEISAKDIFDEIEEEESSEGEEKGRGVFSFLKEKTIQEDDVEDILFELEIGLLEGDVAIDVANEVVESVKEDLVGQKIKRSSDVEEYTYKALQKAIAKIINVDGKSMTEMLEEKVSEGKPLVVMLVGINGTGKTTTIGKLANYYVKKGYTPVIAASDTFRAGAIEQVTQHADNVGVKIIKHQKGSDPAAVAYDAVEHATAQNKELVLIDTAGRMQTNTNLMDEMKKIKRVAKPDLVIFVGDALTGNDATEQARKFNEAIDIDGVILTKADADAKGGASLSIGYVIQKPILFLGVGQGYDDIMEYSAEWMLDQLFS